MEDYKNKVVIVTGACGGIGEIIAEKMAGAGAALGLCDINRDKLDSVADKFQSAGTRVHQAAPMFPRKMKFMIFATRSVILWVKSIV